MKRLGVSFSDRGAACLTFWAANSCRKVRRSNLAVVLMEGGGRRDLSSRARSGQRRVSLGGKRKDIVKFIQKQKQWTFPTWHDPILTRLRLTRRRRMYNFHWGKVSWNLHKWEVRQVSQLVWGVVRESYLIIIPTALKRSISATLATLCFQFQRWSDAVCRLSGRGKSFFSTFLLNFMYEIKSIISTF